MVNPKKIVCFFILLLSSVFRTNAQRTIAPKGIEFQQKGIIYEQEWAIQPSLNTNGFSLAYSFGHLVRYNKTHFKKIEIGYLKHPREHVQSTPPTQLSGGFKNYSFGKINYFFPIRATLGTKRYLSEKSKRKGVALGYSYEGGINLGVIKPYQLKLIRIDPNSEKAYLSVESYSEENADIFLDPTRIAGKAGIFRGFEQFSIRPGFTAKVGALFAWGAYDSQVLALEFGIMLDLFFSNIDLVANNQNQPYALNFYLSMHFGKRR